MTYKSAVPMYEPALVSLQSNMAFAQSGISSAGIEVSRTLSYLSPPNLPQTCYGITCVDNLSRTEKALAPSCMVRQIAIAHFRASHERQRQSVVKLLTLQQNRDLHHQLSFFNSPIKPSHHTSREASFPAVGLDLLTTAATLRRDSPIPSIASHLSTNLTPQNSSSQLNTESVSTMRNEGSESDSCDELEESCNGGETRTYLDDIERNDILCGRGGRSNNHFGNKRYRQVVGKMKCMYQHCPAKTLKTDLSMSIVEHCWSYGARFVKLDERNGKYYVLTKAEARKKTSQALRESKALKWTA
jgi:hypothetical protein